ncbi:hypothetical protein COT42_06420 [Candidatus Saganbacteria bacterium CG08_land_8_20_14_0_20_45_16]|uniref:TonB C-terminal domain-containing protein n=1 Tax=Candidatus Saganbacteria bacterium CG08_land_8_20_14_0_20_45_16 TaxID=2014293 RepID=A0A2H0XXZ6_UNCSA|nr:MAG: hypothetical protein COT42_06420 [Candidatus Saganbacteria bacterium CG08_land_8_20_14_0_20_45_16]
MKTNNLSLVVMGSVLLAAVLVSFLLARPALLQSQSRPVFIGESLVVNNVLAWPMIKAQAMTKVAAQVASVPLLESKVIPILPILAPSISYSFLPSYPAAALRAGVTGVTILSLQIGVTGQVNAVAVKASSGAAELDQAAVSAVSQWGFTPATQGGMAVASCFELPVRFEVK